MSLGYPTITTGELGIICAVALIIGIIILIKMEKKEITGEIKNEI